jgi:hypothetical protein
MKVPQIDTLLGCNWSEFVQYITPMIEARGWTLKEFGIEWTFDHIVPCDAVNVDDLEQLLALNWFQNLDVLTLEENALKNGRHEPGDGQRLVNRYRAWIDQF